MLVEEAVVTRLKEIQSRKQVEILVTGFTALAHAMAICELDHIYHTKMAIMMFHLPVSADDKTLFRDPSVFDKCVSKGILTTQDVHALTGIIPMEVWITYYPDNKPHVRYVPDRRFIGNGGTAS